MIEAQRDPAFWRRIATHPEVAPHALMGAGPEIIAPLLAEQTTIALASQNGGFLFLKLDGFGFVRELHTLYTPEGWGREVALALKEATEVVFATAQVIVTQEQEGWWRSAPPKSHGWKTAGPYREVGLAAPLRTWILTREAWEQSPARRRLPCP